MGRGAIDLLTDVERLTQYLMHFIVISLCEVPASASHKISPRGHQNDTGAGRQRKLICMKHLLLLMSLGSLKRPEDTVFQHRSLRRPRPVSVPTMAWTVLLLGLLSYGSGQGKGFCIFGGHVKAGSQGDLDSNNTCVSPVACRG